MRAGLSLNVICSAMVPGCAARQLAALLLLVTCAAAPPGPSVTWPPGWTVDAQSRARPPGPGGDGVSIDLLHHPGTPGAAVVALSDAFTRNATAAGFEVGCGAPVPVPLAKGEGAGAGCTARGNGLPVAKLSIVAWPGQGGADALRFIAPPGPFQAYLRAWEATVASVRPAS